MPRRTTSGIQVPDLLRTDFAAKLPNSLLVITLVSNFGTFMLYMMTCIVAIVAFREHHMFNGFKHMVVPVFGLWRTWLACCSTSSGRFRSPA